jgi:multiple sugar transport system permease protein
MKRSTPYLLLAPALVFTGFILLFPLSKNLFNSLMHVTLARQGSEWNGLENYASVLSDALFWLSFRNTVIYALAGTVAALVLGLGFAVLLNMRVGKFNDIMGFLYSIPWVVSPVVAGFAWKWLLNDNFGILNAWLTNWGIVHENINWLGDARTALLCVAVARVWQFYPFAMVMFLAGLQCIPQEQYEAAQVDGATPLRKFYHITLPNLRYISSVLLLLGVIWSFNDFNMVFVMTRGGPINASMVLPVLVREYSFVYFNVGKGSALSILVFAMLVLLAFFYLRTVSRRDAA